MYDAHRPALSARAARPRKVALMFVAVACTAGLLGAAQAQAAVTLSDIEISPIEATTIPGRTQAFRATGVYSDGSRADLTSQVAWRARDTKIATIDAAGVATALDGGRSDISATLGRVASRRVARLNVADLDEIRIEPVSANVRPGGSIVLRALGTYDDGTTGVDITSQVTFASKKRSVVEVGVNELGAPVAIGVMRGETIVEAVEPKSGVRSNSTTGKIVVVGALLRIAIEPDARLARVGERVRFKAIGTFERDLVAEVSGDVDWTTGDPSVASIDAEGRATGVALGSTSIVATDRASRITSTASGADGRFDVVGNLTSLEVKPNPLSLALGAKAPLKASALFDGVARSVNFTTKVEWTSSNPSKVSVSRLGLASCLSAGSAVVSARDPFSGITSTASGKDSLVRCGVPVVGVVVQLETLTLRVGKTKKVKAYLLYGDDSRDEITKRVVWESSNLAVATIDRQEPNIGRISAHTPGSATITADDPLTGLGSSAPGGKSLSVTVIP